MPFVTALTGRLYLGPKFAPTFFLGKGESIEIRELEVPFFKSIVEKGIARIDAQIPKDILALQEAALKRKNELKHTGTHHQRGRPPGKHEHKEKVKKK